MIKRVLIIGGYGNFGQFIARVLAKDSKIQVMIAGRTLSKAQTLIDGMEAVNLPEAVFCDIHQNIEKVLKETDPSVVIHTSGPFQGQSYVVAEACIKQGCHYIDLADSRHFVDNITKLDTKAQKKQVLICSGASSVPTLSSAIIDHYIDQFSILESVDYAIATAQLTNQGLATTQGVLSYAGKPFKTLINGEEKKIYGWLGLRLKRFWKLNLRFLGYCDIPDLALFPKRYPQLQTVCFQAGLELKPLQFILYLLSWLVRVRLLPSLDHFAGLMHKISRCFDVFGHNDAGFYMQMQGKDDRKLPKTMRFELFAQHGHGLYIPCVPSIILAKRLVHAEQPLTGASACVGMISLDEYLQMLQALKLDIEWQWACKTPNKG